MQPGIDFDIDIRCTFGNRKSSLENANSVEKEL